MQCQRNNVFVQDLLALACAGTTSSLSAETRLGKSRGLSVGVIQFLDLSGLA